MGKHNNRKRFTRKARKPNPVLAAADAGSASASSIPSPAASGSALQPADQILPLVKKLNSPKPEDRAHAAAAIASHVLDPPTRLELLKGRVIETLITALSVESLPDTAVEIAGALRNTAAFGGDEVCLEMHRRGAVAACLGKMSLVTGVVDALRERRAPASQAEGEKLTGLLDLTEQLITVLWSMAEVSGQAVADVVSDKMLAMLVTIVNPANGAPFRLVEAAAQFLNILTEENDACTPFFASNPEAMRLLASIASSEDPALSAWEDNHVIIRILSASVLYNLRLVEFAASEGTPSNVSAGELYSKLLLPPIAAAMGYDLQDALVRAEAAARSSPGAPGTFKSKDENTIDALVSNLGTLQLTLELLTNMYSEDAVDGEDAGWVPEDAMEDDEAEGEDAMEGDGDAEAAKGEDDEDDDEAFMADLSGEVTGGGDTEMGHAGSSDAFNATRFGLLLRHALLPQILALAGFTCSSILTAAAVAAQFVGSAGLVRLRAFGCLNNVLTCATAAGWFEGNAEEARGVWAWLFETAHKAAAEGEVESGVGRAEVVEAAVTAIWAVARGMDAVKGKEIVPTLDQANALIASCSEPKAAESLKVKCVAILGIVGKAKCNIPVNRVIGDFLVKRLATEPSVEVIAEILNALFDVYADEFFDYDSPVFVKGGYLEKLRKVAPALRSKVKAFDKRRNQLLRERADEAILNLKMFIQYKEGERKNKKK